MSQPDEPYDPAPMPRRFYAGHPDDDAPEFHLGEYSPRPVFARRPTREQLRALEAALAAIDSTGCSSAAVSLPGCAVPAASGSGESRHLAGSHGTAVRPGLATNDEPRR